MMVELESTTIKVNLVCPGFTKTNLNGYEGTAPVEGGRSRDSARGAARPGWTDRHLHAVGKRDDTVVSGRKLQAMNERVPSAHRPPPD